jgi:GxxExxY protein
MEVDQIAKRVIGAAIEVHRHLGPGLMESTYHTCLVHELKQCGLVYETEAPVSVCYKGNVITEAYRLDILVEDCLIIELKSVEKLTDKHKAQLLTYLRLMNKRLGLLINFNEIVLKDGIRRIINGYK